MSGTVGNSIVGPVAVVLCVGAGDATVAGHVGGGAGGEGGLRAAARRTKVLAVRTVLAGVAGVAVTERAGGHGLLRFLLRHLKNDRDKGCKNVIVFTVNPHSDVNRPAYPQSTKRREMLGPKWGDYVLQHFQ